MPKFYVETQLRDESTPPARAWRARIERAGGMVQRDGVRRCRGGCYDGRLAHDKRRLRSPPINPGTPRAGQPQGTPTMKRKQVSLAPTAHPNIATSAAGDDDLASTEGVDYTPLRDLLQSHNWREADRETLALMRRVANGDLEPNALSRFPPVDLRTIDQLWVKYSGGRFGFSVQKYIFRACESTATPFDSQTHQRFGERVGWRDSSSWHNARTYTLEAPAGHLPNYTSFEFAEHDGEATARQPPAKEGNNLYKVTALLSREDLPSTKPTELPRASAKRKHKR